jgi:putative NADPH-quinone reductase
MRVLVVFAHPTKDSFCGSIMKAIVQELNSLHHEVEILDLYANNFCPVMSLPEWRAYESPIAGELGELQRYADQLHTAEGLIWIFPTWNYGLPAILKGYIDRIWRPNIAFRIDIKRKIIFDSFPNIKLFIVATTFGSNRIINAILGNPCKRLLRSLRRHLPRNCRYIWFAAYGLDKPSPRQLNRFLKKISTTTRNAVAPR